MKVVFIPGEEDLSVNLARAVADMIAEEIEKMPVELQGKAWDYVLEKTKEE